MDHDERERRDGQEASAASGQEPREADLQAAPSEPERTIQEPGPESTIGDEPAPAEIESWPSQDVRTEPAAAMSDEARSEPAWPAEEPADVAPASATDETATWEQASSDVVAPPPSEVEAYPATGEQAGAAAATTAAAHTVPAEEGSIGESTQCPRCGTENRPGLAFCRNCGQRLVAAGVATTVERPGAPEGTMACPRCGTHNRAGVAFCQNCGANLRGTGTGYVPPAAVPAEEAAAAPVETARRGAILGPVVLLIGLVGLVTAYLLPFAYGSDSLLDRAFGTGGYGAAFWSAYPEVNANLADQAYFGLAGAVPILMLVVLALAIAGFMRATPGALQRIGLVIALLWSVGFIVLFLVVEVAASWDGDVVGLLRSLTPAGIIFFLSSLIILIGTLTRFARS